MHYYSNNGCIDKKNSFTSIFSIEIKYYFSIFGYQLTKLIRISSPKVKDKRIVQRVLKVERESNVAKQGMEIPIETIGCKSGIKPHTYCFKYLFT
ncbi:MAG TPA: hypothetical protein DCL77_02530 [Prolixibacteraceae bacterium]|nr:hypothetical protein [Prolixibacteraceae bacterium]